MFTSSFDSPGIEPQLGRSVSIDRAAELMRVSRRTVYNRIREGRLQTIRTRCGSQRVLIASLENLGRRFQTFTSPLTTVVNDRPARS